MVKLLKGLFANSRACQHEWSAWQQRNAAPQTWWRVCVCCHVSQIRLEAPGDDSAGVTASSEADASTDTDRPVA